MTFCELLNDIQKLIGLELHSIRPGADVVIEAIDEERDCLILRTVKGELRSRPLSELQSIWDELQKCPAVHVDGVLHGSGTSRNQPETILANLPYIEWLKIDNKKHITYVGRNSHPYGTLRQMPSSLSVDFIAQMKPKSERSNVIACIVSDAINKSINSLQAIAGGTIRAISQQSYVLATNKGDFLFISSSSVDIETGMYLVLDAQVDISFKSIEIAETQYALCEKDGIKALVKFSKQH